MVYSNHHIVREYIKNLAKEGNKSAKLWMDTAFLRKDSWYKFIHAVELLAYAQEHKLSEKDIKNMETRGYKKHKHIIYHTHPLTF
jgi:hydrogenase maturation factor